MALGFTLGFAFRLRVLFFLGFVFRLQASDVSGSGYVASIESFKNLSVRDFDGGQRWVDAAVSRDAMHKLYSDEHLLRLDDLDASSERHHHGTAP